MYTIEWRTEAGDVLREKVEGSAADVRERIKQLLTTDWKYFGCDGDEIRITEEA